MFWLGVAGDALEGFSVSFACSEKIAKFLNFPDPGFLLLIVVFWGGHTFAWIPAFAVLQF